MKIYKNAILIMKVPSCLECPNRRKERVRHGRGYIYYVCSAITRNASRIDTEPGCAEYQYHPSVMEASSTGGFLRDCPLDDWIPGQARNDVQVGANNED